MAGKGYVFSQACYFWALNLDVHNFLPMLYQPDIYQTRGSLYDAIANIGLIYRRSVRRVTLNV